MNRAEFLESLDLKVWKKGDQRAPHKPLLLLLTLGRLSRAEGRFVRFAEIEAQLRQLLKRFGQERSSVRPWYPFWHLTSDGLWEIPEGGHLPNRKGDTPPLTVLRPLRGGVPAAVDRLLRGNPELIETATVMLLNRHFPDSFHPLIRDAVGLTEPMALEGLPGYETTRRRKRDPGFRTAVLAAYQARCAVCDFDIRFGRDKDPLGLEAAHIKWHGYGGPDRIPNGLALCRLHHHALDKGAIGLAGSVDGEFRLLVSQDLRGESDAFRQLLRAIGQPLREPRERSQLPDPAFVDWHRREVFRGEPRMS